MFKHFCLFLVFLAPAQAISFKNEAAKPAIASELYSEGLQKEVDVLHSLLDQKKTDLNRKPKAKIRFKEAIKEASRVLNAIDAAVKKYNMGVASDKNFANYIALLKEDFYSLMSELEAAYGQNDPSSTLKSRVAPSPASRISASTTARQRRRRANAPEPSNTRLTDKGPNIDYTYDDIRSEDEQSQEASPPPSPSSNRPDEPFLDQ